DEPRLRHPAYRAADLSERRPAPHTAAGTLDEDRRADARFGRAAPGCPRLRERLLDPRADSAPARTGLDASGPQDGEPRPRDVVAPTGAGRRVAALRAGVADRVRRARALDGSHLHA